MGLDLRTQKKNYQNIQTILDKKNLENFKKLYIIMDTAALTKAEIAQVEKYTLIRSVSSSF